MRLAQSIIAIACIALASCTIQKEEMYKGAGVLAKMPKGGIIPAGIDLANAGIYVWKNKQFGGTSTWENSMGSSSIIDNQASFQHFVQGVVALGGSIASMKASIAAELTRRVTEGEITTRQANALNQQLALAQDASELEALKITAAAAESAP